MKNLFILFFSISLFLTSCSSTKEITVPCTEKGRSDSQFFRASGSSKSRDMVSSKDKAMLVTKQTLASLIGSTIKSVTDNYLTQQNASSGTAQKFETISREIVNQQLKSISVACEKTQKNKDGNYETFLSLEMPKSAIIQSIMDRVNEEPSLKADFDAEKFKKIAESELNK